ncbi:decapping enzyme dcp2 [Diplodia corticola]|uniref:Decapping enzyme dcp2 n=1 Tax=Diplodia corticola TaxID=236234 RepID=A0A1J9QRT2_9PEZI|nr:decapping enzyme dcp2 [Diplodia corticola]OJD31160.1 decapping enzyme dcp2 [Diplodia corticola]
MAETKMQLVDWLDDLCVRFIINLPKEELESVERICFQVEEAHWFYEDFIRPLDPSLPSMSLKQFCLLIFQHCPLFSEYAESYYSAAYSEFLAYKTRVPVRGAILLNDAMDHVVLVKGWKKGARWSFPRGKINKDEDDLDCAVREVYEETGFDAKEAGLIKDHSQMKYIEVSMREQHMRLYVFRGVPMDTYFEPRTRKEISKISWYKISELPTLKKRQNQGQGAGENLYKENMFYMVAPFLGPLKGWIKQQNKLARRAPAAHAALAPTDEEETAADESAVESTAQHRVSPDTHLESLIAGLRQSKLEPDTTNLPEVTTAQDPSPDPASALKRILSVSGQGGMAPPPPSASPNPLLALLQGGQMQQMPMMNTSSIPATPYEQINMNPSQPDTPHHQPPRPPQFSNMAPPPHFPYSPAHQGLHQRIPMPQPGNGYFAGAMNMPPPPVPNMRPQPPQQQSIPAWHQQPPSYHQQEFPQQEFPQQGFHPQAAAPPRPYQRTGDPEFAHGTPSSAPVAPAIPPPSNLPAPKLNAHTLSLLNAFKGEQSAVQQSSPQPAIRPFTAASEIYNSNRPHHQQPSATVPEVLHSRPDEMAQDSNYIDGQPPPVAFANKPRTAQADALLGLFRKPSTSGPVSPPQEMPAQSLVPEPAELSAQSPSIDRQKLASSQGGYISAESLEPNVNMANHNKAGETSATVSGPFNAPDFDQLRKHTRVSQSNGRASPRTQGRPTSRPERQATPQFSILSRPRPEVSATPSPKHTPSAPVQRRDTSSPRSILEAPKPFAPHFTPQILRRPQNAMSPTSSRLHSFDRRESASSDQKSALLSLFSKPQTQSPKGFPSGVISPVSPLPEKQHGSGGRSRISSINSVPGEGLGSRSARGSVSGQPTTPVDKSFLLGYLNGVVKDAGKQ